MPLLPDEVVAKTFRPAALARHAESLRSAAQSDADTARRRVEEAERRAQQTEDAALQRWDALRIETEQGGITPPRLPSGPPRSCGSDGGSALQPVCPIEPADSRRAEQSDAGQGEPGQRRCAGGPA